MLGSLPRLGLSRGALTVSFGKAPRIWVRLVYICSAVPSKNFPQPPTNSVSPAGRGVWAWRGRALAPFPGGGWEVPLSPQYPGVHSRRVGYLRREPERPGSRPPT